MRACGEGRELAPPRFRRKQCGGTLLICTWDCCANATLENPPAGGRRFPQVISIHWRRFRRQPLPAYLQAEAESPLVKTIPACVPDIRSLHERTVADRGLGGIRIRMMRRVGGVERLSPESQFESLGNLKLAVQTEIEVYYTRSRETVVAASPDVPGGRNGKRQFAVPLKDAADLLGRGDTIRALAGPGGVQRSIGGGCGEWLPRVSAENAAELPSAQDPRCGTFGQPGFPFAERGLGDPAGIQVVPDVAAQIAVVQAV